MTCVPYVQYREGQGWIKGKIQKWDGERYTVDFLPAHMLTIKVGHTTIVEWVLIASLRVGTALSVYSYCDDTFYEGVIMDVDDTKLDNFLVKFVAGMNDWLDIRRFKYHILRYPGAKKALTLDDENVSLLAQNTEQEAVAPHTESGKEHDKLDGAPPPTNDSTTTTDVEKTHSLPSVQPVSAESRQDLALVVLGTVLAVRWKEKYRLYDATVVKIKGKCLAMHCWLYCACDTLITLTNNADAEDGSQYQVRYIGRRRVDGPLVAKDTSHPSFFCPYKKLQYHYDATKKWVDLRSAEFYVIGHNAVFNDSDAAYRPKRRRSVEPDLPPTT